MWTIDRSILIDFGGKNRGFSFNFFDSKKCWLYNVYRPNWQSATMKSYALLQSSTLDTSRRCLMTTSGSRNGSPRHAVCNGAGCWCIRPPPIAPVPAATLTTSTLMADVDYMSSTPAVCCAGNLQQTVCHYQYQRVSHSNTRQRWTSDNMNLICIWQSRLASRELFGL